MNKLIALAAGTLSIALFSSVMSMSAANAAPHIPDSVTTYKKEAPVSDEYRRAHSKAAKDLHGYEKSLYRGKYYIASQESWRKCVMWRESNYNYDLIGAGYNWPYHGAYQFHNVNWKRGLIFMMAKESKQTKDGLNGEARKLKHKNINQWNRYWQDRALFTALNYNGPYSGAHHWAMTNGGC